MLAQSLQTILQERLGPDGVKQFFYLGQAALGAIFLGVLWMLRSREPKSGFAVRESDLKKPKTRASGAPDLANAKLDRKVPLRLEGIRIDGPPHEILGLQPGADAAQIQRAYRDRMKQYHPDKIGPPGSREWQDAQKIAEAINRAKTELLKRVAPPKR